MRRTAAMRTAPVPNISRVVLKERREIVMIISIHSGVSTTRSDAPGPGPETRRLCELIHAITHQRSRKRAVGQNQDSLGAPAAPPRPQEARPKGSTPPEGQDVRSAGKRKAFAPPPGRPQRTEDLGRTSARGAKSPHRERNTNAAFRAKFTKNARPMPASLAAIGGSPATRTRSAVTPTLTTKPSSAADRKRA